MNHEPELSPQLARGVLLVARALLAAARNWTLYPPEHPAVAQSVARLSEALRETATGGTFTLGIMPETLLVDGTAADRTHPVIAEAAGLLHDRDLLQITFTNEPP